MDIKIEDLKSILGSDSKVNIVPMIDPESENMLFEHIDLSRPMPVLPLLDQVLFPGVIIPIAARREKARRLLKDCSAEMRDILVFPQVRPSDDPSEADLFRYGVSARVLKSFDFKDNTTVAILQGLERVTDLKISERDPYYWGFATPAVELYYRDREMMRRMKVLRRRYAEIVRLRTQDDDIASMMANIRNDRLYINFASTNIDVEVDAKCQLLEAETYQKRIDMLLDQLSTLKGIEELRHEIDSRTQDIIGKQQREWYLRHQMDVIQEELGESSGNGPSSEGDVAELRKRAEQIPLPQEVREVFDKESQKLSRMGVYAPDYSVQLSYLETLLDIPWEPAQYADYTLQQARDVLDRDHFGIKKVKDRVIEYLAVVRRQRERSLQSKAQVLCLVGPPGTGKTSVCRSVAEALGRPYRRIALGGLHDEAEIRGHRRTYIGAMPGRIIQELIKAHSSNPVFVLDEIDKVQTNTFHGDPSSALLEVLDPEQNCHFHDNFLGIEYDLSHVLFIATANSVSDIQPALLDRMEIIEFSGYVLEEKTEIAARHLLPRLMKDNVVDRRSVKFPTEVIQQVINDYTREGGVRQLEKQLAKLVRHRVVMQEMGEKCPAKVTADEVHTVLGLPVHSTDRARTAPAVGIVTGLAWTPVGGEILFIEASTSHGKGVLSLTGNLGDVMKESATLAFEYIKSHATQFGIDPKQLEETNLHIHVPEGAVPKDGPSAGITMFTAMFSVLTSRPVLPHVAMTGEITLRGDVTPVGGIKEKILAAKRAGITTLILCHDNQRDIEEIEPEYLTGLTFHYIHQMSDVLPLALVPVESQRRRSVGKSPKKTKA